VDRDISVKNGHAIGHKVNDRLKKSSLAITDVVIHIEPARDGNLVRGRK